MGKETKDVLEGFPRPLSVIGGLLFYGVRSALKYTNPYESVRKADGVVFKKFVGEVDVLLGSPATSIRLGLYQELQYTGEFKLFVDQIYSPKKDKDGNIIKSKDGKVIENHEVRFSDNFHDLISPKLAAAVNQHLAENPDLLKEGLRRY